MVHIIFCPSLRRILVDIGILIIFYFVSRLFLYSLLKVTDVNLLVLVAFTETLVEFTCHSEKTSRTFRYCTNGPYHCSSVFRWSIKYCPAMHQGITEQQCITHISIFGHFMNDRNK